MDALARVLLVLTIAAGGPPIVSAQPRSGSVARPPCATCLAIAVLPEQLVLLPDSLNGLEILVDAAAQGSGLAGVIEGITRRGGRGGVVLHGLDPLNAADLSGASTALLDIRDAAPSFDALVFALRTLSTSIKAGAAVPPRIVVAALEASRGPLHQLTAQGYWDAVVDGAAPDGWRDGGMLAGAVAALEATRTGPGRRLLLTLGPDAGQARRALADLALAARWLDDSLVSDSGGLRIRCGERTATAVYRQPLTLDRVALLERCDPERPVVTDPPLPVDRAQLSSGAALVRIAEPAPDRFTAAAEVAAPRQLTVEEIVGRHQAAAARQLARVRTLTSSGTLTVTFEAPGFPAPVTVASSTTIHAEGTRTDLEQRDIRVNGVAFRRKGTPKLPLIEPERVAAPPLAITLGDRYRYRLAGEETIHGVPAYVVGFEPLDGRVSAFRGRAWIAREDFGVVRIEARQTALRGPVVSSEQTDEFTRAMPGVWVLARSDVRQLYEGAAYRTPIHRVLSLDTHEVNAADFADRRRRAYASDHTILRDTPSGYRYVEGAARQAVPESGTSSPAEPERGGRPSARVRTLAFGVIVDPNISQPLPFAGLSYLDFNLFGTGAQFNGFFGGSYGQLAFSVPSIRGSRWQIAGRAFGIASSYNDRAFVGGREQYDRNLRQRPAAASVWVVRPLTARLAMRIGYDLEYTALARSEVTASSFVSPADQLAHGLRVELTGQRAGWDGTAWWVGSRRTGWHAWGRSGSVDYRPADANFQRYGGSMARSLVVSPQLVGRIELSAMAGQDLDRFSRFAFGTFDNRLRGYPSALIRYDGGAVARGVLGWS
ncbi:MAG: hypothetical protein ABI211_18490, partial [Vicinamibacterales bacterium]